MKMKPYSWITYLTMSRLLLRHGKTSVSMELNTPNYPDTFLWLCVQSLMNFDYWMQQTHPFNLTLATALITGYWTMSFGVIEKCVWWGSEPERSFIVIVVPTSDDFSPTKLLASCLPMLTVTNYSLFYSYYSALLVTDLVYKTSEKKTVSMTSVYCIPGIENLLSCREFGQQTYM